MKNSIIRIFILSLGLLVGSNLIAQERDLKKANKQFDKYAYIDAQKIYLEVIEDGYTSAEIFKKLGDTYYYNSNYESAAKWYQRLVNEFPNEAETQYYYRAAQSLKSLKKYDESDKLMKRYAEMGGDKLIVLNFENDPDYLKSIAFQAKGYDLVKAEINTKGSDFGPSFYLNKLVYASASNSTGEKIAVWNDQPYLDLFEADMDETGLLTNPTKLPGDVNTAYHESTPTFTKDGKTMYFTRNNFNEGKKGRDKERTIRLNLYKATKGDNGKWTDVKELPFNSKTYSTAHPALSPDGKRLYFASDMPGTIGMSDLYYVDITGVDTYGTPVNLGPDINTEGRESFPFISKKNNLYFSSDARAGLGGFDIFITPLDNAGRVGKITNLGEPANTGFDDFAFVIDEERHLGFLSSNRDGGKGSSDDEIYRVKEKCVINISGLVTDIDTGEILPGAKVSLLDTNNNSLKDVVADETGRYTLTADCNSQFTVRATKENYAPFEKVLKTPKESGDIELPIPLKTLDPCPPNDLGCRLTLQPIYFDFDKDKIRPDAEIELAKILAAMREYPQLIIHIESHTDSRGNDNYNMQLSERRAQSTLKWLIEKGIDKDRLSARGYGESQLVNQCSNGVKCTEEEHQLNRRSMFLIQN